MKPLILNHCKRVLSLRWSAMGRKAIASSFSTSAVSGEENPSNEKLYELRTYSIVPAKMSEFMKIMDDNMQLRTAHSKLIGYWYTDLGGINEAVHIWEYDSYAHRTEVRKAVAADREWVEKCFSRILPMFAAQTNVVLRAFPWYSPRLEPVKGYSCYELTKYQFKPGLLAQGEHRMRYGFPDKLSPPIGLWYSELGRLFSTYSLGQFANLEERSKNRKKLLDDEEWRQTFEDILKFMDGIEVKALTPASFSPLQ